MEVAQLQRVLREEAEPYSCDLWETGHREAVQPGKRRELQDRKVCQLVAD